MKVRRQIKCGYALPPTCLVSSLSFPTRVAEGRTAPGASSQILLGVGTDLSDVAGSHPHTVLVYQEQLKRYLQYVGHLQTSGGPEIKAVRY